MFFAFPNKCVKLCFSEYVAYYSIVFFVSTQKIVLNLGVKIYKNAAL